MKLKCLEATDSNGIELYLFQLEDNSFISVPKRALEFKPLSPEELKEMKGAENNKECHKPESLYYRCYCDERKEDEYCNGCKFWYESQIERSE